MKTSNKMVSELPVHYRYVDRMYEDGIHLVLEKMYPVRETPCFYMCINEWMYSQYKCGFTNQKEKRISKDGLRRYAYPTKEEALKSYIKRKASQNFHATQAIERSQLAIEFFQKIKTPPSGDESVNMGKCDFYENMIFD